MKKILTLALFLASTTQGNVGPSKLSDHACSDGYIAFMVECANIADLTIMNKCIFAGNRQLEQCCDLQRGSETCVNDAREHVASQFKR